MPKPGDWRLEALILIFIIVGGIGLSAFSLRSRLPRVIDQSACATADARGEADTSEACRDPRKPLIIFVTPQAGTPVGVAAAETPTPGEAVILLDDGTSPATRLPAVASPTAQRSAAGTPRPTSIVTIVAPTSAATPQQVAAVGATPQSQASAPTSIPAPTQPGGSASATPGATATASPVPPATATPQRASVTPVIKATLQVSVTPLPPTATARPAVTATASVAPSRTPAATATPRGQPPRRRTATPLPTSAPTTVVAPTTPATPAPTSAPPTAAPPQATSQPTSRPTTRPPTATAIVPTAVPPTLAPPTATAPPPTAAPTAAPTTAPSATPLPPPTLTAVPPTATPLPPPTATARPQVTLIVRVYEAVTYAPQSGWEIQVFPQGESTVLASLVSNPAGEAPASLDPGGFRICALAPAGWRVSYPDGGCYFMSLGAGNTTLEFLGARTAP